MKQSMAPVPEDLLCRGASGQVVEAWMVLDRCSPLKSTSALRWQQLRHSIGSVSAEVSEGAGSKVVSGAGGSPGASWQGGVASGFS